MNRTTLVATCAVAALLPGCITIGGRDDAAPPDAFHVVDAGASSSVVRSAAAPLVVEVRAVRAADRFDRHVLRLDAPGRVTPLEHDFWADEPSKSASDAIRESLAESRRFASVVDPGHPSDVVLDGTLREFGWAPGSPSRAVVRLRLTWSDARTGRVFQSRVHDASEPLPGDGTDGIGPAMARAIERAVSESAASAAAAFPPR